KRRQCKRVYGREVLAPGALVSQSTNNVNEVSEERSSVKVGGRKRFWGISKNADRAVGIVDEDVVVNAEIRVIPVLVFTADLNDALVVQKREGLTESLGTPHRVSLHVPLSIMTLGCKCGDAGADHCQPERHLLFFRVGFSESACLTGTKF